MSEFREFSEFNESKEYSGHLPLPKPQQGSPELTHEGWGEEDKFYQQHTMNKIGSIPTKRIVHEPKDELTYDGWDTLPEA